MTPSITSIYRTNRMAGHTIFDSIRGAYRYWLWRDEIRRRDENNIEPVEHGHHVTSASRQPFEQRNTVNLKHWQDKYDALKFKRHFGVDP